MLKSWMVPGFIQRYGYNFFFWYPDTVFPHIIAAATIIFWKLECGKCGNYSREETIVFLLLGSLIQFDKKCEISQICDNTFFKFFITILRRNYTVCEFSGCQSIRMSKYPICQSIQMSKYPDVKVSGCQSIWMSKYPDVKVSRYQSLPYIFFCFFCNLYIFQLPY